MSNVIWQKAAKTLVKISGNPLLQANETLVNLVKTLLNEKQAKFITYFKKAVSTFEKLKEKSGMDDKELMEMLNSIMDIGVIMDFPNKDTGLMNYLLLAPLPYLWEYSLVKENRPDKKKKLAQIHEKMTEEGIELTQKNYEGIKQLFKTQFPPLTRTIPIEETLGVPQEQTLPFYEASKIIDKQDILSLSDCPCKLNNNLIEENCRVTDDIRRCFHFGNTGRFFIEHGFGESVSKERAKEILKAAADEGLVHKAFHYFFDPQRGEEALCNCCKCCCVVFQSYHRGIWPFHTVTSYLARLDEEKCKGCGICVEKCPIEAVSLINNKSHIDETKCIGCGVCVHHCPENARNLEKTEFRNVYLPPIKR